MDTIAGVPLHPLIVHVPVVFIPLTLVCAVVAVAWRARRGDLSVVTAGLAFVAMLGAQLATMSGEPLEERVPRSSLIGRHAALGETARNLAILAFAASLAFAIREWRDRLPLPADDRVRRAVAGRVPAVAVSVALLAACGASTVFVVRAGHLGAEAAWQEAGARDVTAPGR